MASHPNSVLYPEGQVEVFRSLSVTLGLLATTVISYCFAQRAYHVDFFSRRGLASINITKWLLLLLFIDSWAFVFLSGVLVNGVGMSLGIEACSLGIFACIVFYCVSKLLTYLFLLEKVYIVWPSKRGRWASIPYRIGFCAVLGFVVVFIMMLIGRIAYLTDDRQCIIGLQKASSMTTLFVDLFVNILLTSLFLWPLWRSKLLSPNIRRVASRTLVASFAALAISATNMSILTIVHGQELGWVCLASCSTDVVVNAMVLFWLTRPGQSSDEPTSHGGHGNNHGPGHNRSEAGKSTGGGGVVHLQRISAAPGVYGHTSSANGLSRPSTAVGTRSQPDVEAGFIPRSPMKINFSHSGVYDGSHPYVRGGSDAAFGLRSPVDGDKGIHLPPSPTSALFLKDRNGHPPSFFKDQKRHSSGIIYEKTVTTGATESTGPTAFFSKIMGRRTPSGDQRVGSMSMPGVLTFGGKKRPKSEEDLAVRVTITTRLEQDDDTLGYEGSSRVGSEPNRSKEDQSKV